MIETQSLNSFLSGVSGHVKIPIYQRAYEWENIHIEQFIDDLDYFMTSEEDSFPHFFGMVVYVQFGEDIEVIDGQQRITTFSLLLSMLGDWLQYESARNDSQKMDNDKRSKLLTIFTRNLEAALFEKSSLDNSEPFPKLISENTKPYESEITHFMLCDFDKIKSNSLNEDENYITTRENLFYVSSVEDVFNDLTGQKNQKDADNYNKFYNCFDGLTARSSKSRPIVKNYKQLKDYFFMKKIGNLTSQERYEKLKKLMDILQHKFNIIPYKTSDRVEAYNLFEVLNDRGKRVSHADLIKNICITKSSEKVQQEEMYNNWQKELANKVPKDLIGLLRYSYMSRVDFSRKSELFKRYKDLLSEKDYNTTKEYIKDQLGIDADNYNKCLLIENINEKERIQTQLTLLFHTNVFQYRTIAIALLRRKEIAENEYDLIVDILKEVFEIIFHMKANKIRFVEIEKEFPEFARSVNSSLTSTLQMIKAFKNSKGYTFGKAKVSDNELYKDNKFCALLLMMYKAKNQALTDKKYTVEHVLPQGPKKDDWGNEFKELFYTEKENKNYIDIREKAEEAYTYSIGNMLLLEGGTNSALGNKKWDDKKAKLIEKGISKLLPESGLVEGETVDLDYASQDKWDKKVIKNREIYVREKLKQEYGNIKFRSV